MDPSRQANGREMTRAERFEDEKRRIVDSCFNKKDTDGSLLETYITHIKITEFSSHPSGPPPPEARTPQSEKPRVIIVAVRKSGRVRMHKSKENVNGTFSIGKTWDLNDLTAIESFTGPTVDALLRQYAGDTGFTVSVGKPYYWLAQADKEKKFFIASLIKIYGKYTGGNIPELVGFDPRELDQVLGSRRAPGRTPPVEQAPAPVVSADPRAPVPSNLSGSTLASGGQGYRPGRPAASPARNLAPPNGKASSPAPSMDSSRVSNQSTALGRLAGNNRSQDSVAASFSTAKSEDASSIPPRSRGGMNGPGAAGRFGDPADAPIQTPAVPPPIPVDLPDRKRPPMDPARPQFSDRDLVPAPLMSPGVRGPQPPPRNAGRKNSVNQRSETSSLQGSFRERPSATPEPTAPAFAPSPASATTPTPTLPPIPAGSPFVSGPTTPAAETPIGTPTEEDARPGLGPMIKSKKSKADLAGTLWKAASAAAAFKPRPGGAGERLRDMQRKNSTGDGPDGITGVVPAPPRAVPKPETPKVEPAKPVELPKSPKRISGLPEVKVTVPNASRPTSLQASIKGSERDTVQSKAAAKKDQESRDSVVVGNDARYLAQLGATPDQISSFLSNPKAQRVMRICDQFGFVPGSQGKIRNYNHEELLRDIDREINRIQAGAWVERFDDNDERVEAIKDGLDRAIGECEELDNLLTLYSVELSTLVDDINYIEAQGQGLQVQAANQKLLKKELESLLDTCAIMPEDLMPLETQPLDNVGGLEEIETTLVTLYKAMMKIDPTMGNAEAKKTDEADQQSGFHADYGKMRIVQEKKELYLTSSSKFLQRFEAFLYRQYDQAVQETKRSMDGALSKKVDPLHHDAGRELLWRYSPVMVYARDLDLTAWNQFIQVYQNKNSPLYKTEFKEVLEAWKRNARKPTGEEAELLFTAQLEKQQESTVTTARKLTVKRSQTLAKSLRSPLSDGSRTPDKLEKLGDRSLPYEVFAGIVDDLLPLVEIEQNFIIDFFHATTLEANDFPDAVGAAKPRDRRGTELRRHRLMEPDRDLARRVTKAMEIIFAFLEQDLSNIMSWVLAQDPLQGVGVLAILERKHTEISQTNQDFLNNILQKLHGILETRFTKFVEEQIRAIEDTKVKIKKRKGVISFMRVFPQFSSAIENMMATVDVTSSVRRTIDREYERIIKSMFESLKVIARENPATLTSSGADPEDKEALNFHILLIENMNHFSEEVDTRNLEILEEFKEEAGSQLAEHMGLYLNAVMRRPLGKLLEYLENIESQLASGKSGSTIAAQPSNAKGTFNKVLSGYDGREVKKGVEALKKRVEKHFGDADEPQASRILVNRVLKECEKFYGDVEVRINTITTSVYGGDVLFEWPRAEVKSAFTPGGR